MDKGIKEDKASDFIIRNSTEGQDGVRRLNVNSAIIELFSRLKTLQIQVSEIQEAFSYLSELEERISKLEGNKKIEVVSPDQAKIILRE